MRTIIYVNLIPFCLLVLFLILVLYNPIFNKRQEKLFIIATVIELFMIIVISADFIFSESESNVWFLRSITTLLNFSVCPLVPLFLYKISIEKTSRYFYWLAALNIIICVISLFNGWVFSINKLNNYDRGPLFFIPFIITVIFMIFLIMHQGYHHQRSKLTERLFLVGVIGMISLGMILEIAFRFYFFSWIMAAICLPMYYLLLSINHSILDPLTGAYNRLMYTKDLERVKGKQKCVIALLDINDFKNVNDQYGHEVGDQYLIRFVTFFNAIPMSASFYRIGGDEFVLIAKKTDINKTLNLVENIRIEARKEKIEFSYGIDMYHPEDDLSQFLNEIDIKMYENKKTDKEALLKE